MSISSIPHVNNVDAGRKHRDDEAIGFGHAVELALLGLGYLEPRLVGLGTEARVYEARTEASRRVAIRVCARFALTKRRNQATWRNRMSGWLLCRLPLKHTNLVECLGSGVLRVPDPEQGLLKLPFLVMEFVPGKSLRSALVSREFVSEGAGNLVKVWLGILRGMVALYRCGMRHGDLSPVNVLLHEQDGRPVIIDLRFSTHLGRKLEHDRSDLHRTLREMLTGTYQLAREPSRAARDALLEYWSPWSERAEVRRALEEWMDLADALVPGGRLGKAALSNILEECTRVSRRQAESTQGLPMRFL